MKSTYSRPEKLKKGNRFKKIRYYQSRGYLPFPFLNTRSTCTDTRCNPPFLMGYPTHGAMATTADHPGLPEHEVLSSFFLLMPSCSVLLQNFPTIFPSCVISSPSTWLVFQSVLKIWSPEFNIYYDKLKSFTQYFHSVTKKCQVRIQGSGKSLSSYLYELSTYNLTW